MITASVVHLGFANLRVLLLLLLVLANLALVSVQLGLELITVLMRLFSYHFVYHLLAREKGFNGDR
jgi:hypothetical protein